MGWPGMAEKFQNQTTQGGGYRRVRRPIRGHPAAAGREISRRWSSGGGAPPWLVHVQWWWPESAPTAETRMALKRVETTQFEVHGFWGNFSWVFWVGYPLGMQN